MAIRYPPPLSPGSRIGITAPSAGVADHHRPRLDFCVAWLRERGYEVVVGECMDGAGVTSAPPRERAAELTAMLTDPQIAAVVPPWGGELAVEILPHLDFDVIAAAPPTWLVGYSDTSTILTPLTLRTGLATIHGHNLMDTPYRLAPEVSPWYEAATTSAGATFTQTAVTKVRSVDAGFDRWEDGSEIAVSTQYTLDEPTRGWSLLGHNGPCQLDVSGRLIGGCLEVLAPLTGSPYGDLSALVAEGDGLIVYLEASGNDALDTARRLWTFRLAGWFDAAHTRAVLIGRTHAPDSPGFSQRDAVASALGDLPIPVVLDVDCGHVVPAIALVNGAVARVVIEAHGGRVDQTLR
jgi:muramoyltetrapeptide carboxypeptidase